MAYIHCETTKQLHNFVRFTCWIQCYFWRGEILGPEEHHSSEVTQVSFEGKMAVVVYLVAIGSLSPWHNFTLTLH